MRQEDNKQIRERTNKKKSSKGVKRHLYWRKEKTIEEEEGRDARQ